MATTSQAAVAPPDLATARRFLRGLTGADAAAPLPGFSPTQCARWSTAHGLGPLAGARFRDSWPELTERLAPDRFAATAETGLLFDLLGRILDALLAANMRVVVLKGAALAVTVYDSPECRPMSDVDLWLPPDAIRPATRLMSDLGLRTTINPERPLAWQEHVGGEIQFFDPAWRQGAIEFHWSPFKGDWLQRVAAVDVDGVWQRCRAAVVAGRPVAILAPEDMIIHLALHLAVNHQFGLSPVRSLVDIVLVARQGVDWPAILRRARAWRVATAVWQVLSLAETLIGVPGLDPAQLAQLAPGAWRRRRLAMLVNPTRMLAGRDIRESRRRWGLLFLLVDRPRALPRLIGRLFWPETEWLVARYGSEAPRRRHLWGLVRHGRL